MKTILVLSTVLLAACSTSKDAKRSIASESQIVAETTNVKNNGDKLKKCELIIREVDMADEIETHVYIRFYNNPEYAQEYHLFNILPDGSPAVRWNYGGEPYRPQPKHAYIKPNALAPKGPQGDSDTGFTSKPNELRRESEGGYNKVGYKMKFRDGDFHKITHIEWLYGPNKINQAWLRPMSLIFHNDWQGDKGFCEFK